MRTLLIALAALLAMPAAAATVTVAPGGFATAFKAAACGDVLQLAPGTHAKVSVNSKVCPATNPIRITGPRDAVIDTWRFTNVRGLEVSGVTLKNSLGGVALQFDATETMAGGQPNFRCGDIRVRKVNGVGPYTATIGQPFVIGAGKGVSFLWCEDVGLYDSRLQGFESAALFGVSRRVEFMRNHCEFNSADCSDFGQVWGATVEDNVVGSAIVANGNHPDGFQFFSRYFYPNSLVPAPPTSDLTIRRNMVAASAQGVFLGNHTRTYADGQIHDDGGFDRVLIEDNVIAMSGGNAILTGDARGVRLRRNWVRSFALAPFAARLTPLRSTVVEQCGNRVDGFDGKPGVIEPACQ